LRIILEHQNSSTLLGPDVFLDEVSAIAFTSYRARWVGFAAML
jgi:hypothetical protein